MSRSKKKPYYTDQQSGCTKKAKRTANRKVRAALKKATKDAVEQPADGKAYRKVSNSWNIRDWSFRSKEPKARRK